MPKRSTGPLRGCTLRGRTWWYKRRLSPKNAAVVGKSNLSFNLKTSDARIAAQRAVEARKLADRTIALAKRTPTDVETAETFRLVFKEDPDIDIASDWLDQIEEQKGYDYARELSHIAFDRKRTLSAVTEERLEVDPVADKTADQIRVAMNLLHEFTGVRFLEDLTGKIAHEFADKLVASGRWSRSTCQRHISKIKSVMSHAMRRQYIVQSPFHGVTVRGVQPTKRREPTEPELRLLIDNAQGALKSGLRVLAMSGLRISELCAVGVSNGFLEVTQGKTKTSIRSVPIHSCITDDVQHWLASKMSPDLLSKNFKILRDSLEVDPNVTIHGFRKYFYQSLLDVEPRVHLVNRIIGHANPPLLQVYGGTPSKQALREVIEKLRDPVAQ